MLGIDNVEVEYGVNLHRDVVAGDHVLGRYLDDLDSQIPVSYTHLDVYKRQPQRSTLLMQNVGSQGDRVVACVMWHFAQLL